MQVVDENDDVELPASSSPLYRDLTQLEEAGIIFSWSWEVHGDEPIYFIWHNQCLRPYTARGAARLVHRLGEL